MKTVECSWAQRLASYGAAVVAAAGNDYRQYVGSMLPAACPDAMVVTSIDSDNTPSDFSNVAFHASGEAVFRRIIGAPGSDIFQTYKDQ